MLQSQTVWSGHPGQKVGPDSEACGQGRSRRFWSGHGAVPLVGALGNHVPDQVGRVL